MIRECDGVKCFGKQPAHFTAATCTDHKFQREIKDYLFHSEYKYKNVSRYLFCTSCCLKFRLSKKLTQKLRIGLLR